MSYLNEQLDYLLDCQADLDLAISEKDWKKASEIIFSVEENGYGHEARMMKDSMNRAYGKPTPFEVMQETHEFLFNQVKKSA